MKIRAPGSRAFGLARRPKPAVPGPFYTAKPMPSDSPRNWTRTYVSVIAIEVIVLLGLWWLQRHYGV